MPTNGFSIEPLKVEFLAGLRRKQPMLLWAKSLWVSVDTVDGHSPLAIGSGWTESILWLLGWMTAIQMG